MPQDPRRTRLISIVVIGFFTLCVGGLTVGLIESETALRDAERKLHKAQANAEEMRAIGEADSYFLPDDFIRAAQTLRREPPATNDKLHFLLYPLTQRGCDALDDPAITKRLAKLSEASRIAALWTFLLPDGQRPPQIPHDPERALTCSLRLLEKPANITAFRRLIEEPSLLVPPAADLKPGPAGNVKDPAARRVLYQSIHALLLNGRETPLRAYAAALAGDPPVKPLTFDQQFVLTKELEFLFLIGRGEKARPRAVQLLDGYFIRNDVLRARLEGRIREFERKRGGALRAR
jgi:hypothetical protein